MKIDFVNGGLNEGNPLENIQAISTETMEVIMKEGSFVKGY